MLVKEVRKHLSLLVRRQTDRSAPAVQLPLDSQGAFSDAFDFLSTEVRNDLPPFRDGGRTESERPRDIRGSLKVLNNVLFEHSHPFTTVETSLQPQLRRGGLTSVAMDKRLTTLADRLRDAMGDEISGSDLARACGVSPAAVSKWLDGQTKELKAANYVDAARALGVREEWLRTGKVPRERDADGDDRQLEHVMDLLEDLRSPLAALAAALEQISKARPENGRKRRKA
jgi:transcriptional regulator with XRE-family HTH domain